MNKKYSTFVANTGARQIIIGRRVCGSALRMDLLYPPLPSPTPLCWGRGRDKGGLQGEGGLREGDV